MHYRFALENLSMGAPDIILQLRNSGYSIRVDDGFLDISPAEVPAALVREVTCNKADILCVLHREDELKRLILLVCEHHKFSQEDYTEALEHALGDQVNAVVCLTTLARQEGLT
jgi:hypothetical protein